MPLMQSRWTQSFITVGQTFFGIVLALAPVTFWVAWSPFVFLLVVAVTGACAGMFVLLHGWEQSTSNDQRVFPGRRSMPCLPGEFVEELHRIFPLTYHHSLHGRTRFRLAMEKLRRLTN